MLIEAAGFKGIYIDKILALGNSTNNINSFVRQRRRWCCGCIQMDKKYKILEQKGLNIKQKLEYISCVSYWFFSLKVLLYLIAPVLFSIFNIIIVDSSVKMFIIMWLPQYILKRFMLDKIYQHSRSTTWDKIYETILFPALTFECLKEIIGISRKKFEVTEKGSKVKEKNVMGLKLFICHLSFLSINVISYILSIEKGQFIPTFFSLINIIYLLIAIVFDINNKTKIEENTEKFKTDGKYSLKSLFSIFVTKS